MTLEEATAVYVYLQNAQPSKRDRHPAWRAATRMLHEHAVKIMLAWERGKMLVNGAALLLAWRASAFVVRFVDRPRAKL